MPPLEPSDEDKLMQQPADFEPPFTPAQPFTSDGAVFDDTHPSTDANIQPEEIYEEGVSGAAEVTEPNAGNAVTGYDPNADGRE